MDLRPLAVLLALLFAGCTDDPTEDVDEAGGVPAVQAIAAPTWTVGDWWTYDGGGPDPVTLVVTGDAGDAWTVDTDNPDMAFFHAAFGQVSTLGAIGKKHLDGSQEAGPVHFLDFPLTDGKTWSLAWDGIDFQATARLDGRQAHVTAEADDGRVRTYTYDGAVGWFRTLEALDPNGTVEFGIDLRKSGQGYGGEVVRWTVHGVHAYHMGNGENLFDEFQVPQEATDVWYGLETHCDPAGLEGDQGAYTLAVGSEASHYENGIQLVEECPNAISTSGTLEPDPGQWGVMGGSVGGTVDVVLVPRTEEWFGVGAGAA